MLSSYDNKTHGLQATLVSNITKNELTISASYVNKTDPASLDLKMGFEFDILTQDFAINHQVFFTDTYEYWGFDWLVDYGKQPISATFKVAYNPQTIFFKWEYGERNFAVNLQPNFPVIALDVGINWQPEMLNLTLNMDLVKALISMSANTSTHSYGSHIGWVKKKSVQEFNVSGILKGLDMKHVNIYEIRITQEKFQYHRVLI